MPDPQETPQNVEPNADNRALPSAAGNEENNQDNTEFDSFDNPGPQQNGRGSLTSFIFMTIMLFFFTKNGGEDFIVRNHYRESLKNLRFQQSNFSAWLWSGGMVNVSAGMNFTLPEPDNSSRSLAHSVMGFGVPLHPVTSSYYTNITGFVHGPVEVHNLTLNTLDNAIVDSNASPASGTEVPLSDSPRASSPPQWAQFASEYIKNINMTEAVERIGIWNWSAPAEMAFRVIEKRPVLSPSGSRWVKSEEEQDIKRMNESVWADISLMHGRVELTNKETGDELAFDMEAVHFIENGTIYGLAEPSGRHVDVRGLPSLVPLQYSNTTAQAINAELLTRIHRLQYMIDSGTIEFDTTSSEEVPRTSCPFTLYAQLVPTTVSKDSMLELESEMEHPTGITTVTRPPLQVNAVLMSKECGIILELRAAEGLKSQRFWRKVITYAATAAIIYLVLLVLFMRQTAVSQTPSGIARVSRWAFLAQAAADSISFVGHVTFVILADGRPSMSLIAPAFLVGVLLAHELQFSVIIHQIQFPEFATSWRLPITLAPAPTRQNGTPDTPAPAAPSDAPLPAGTNVSPTIQGSSQVTTAVTPTPTPTPAPPPSPAGWLSQIWRNLRDSPQARFWLTVAVTLTLVVRVLASPNLAMVAIASMYSNLWMPQIVRSARRGTTSGLRFEYLFGTTICRAFFPLYLFACPKNVLGIESSPWIFILVAFMLLQVIIIIIQDNVGPGFFLPRNYTPATRYDYHPYIPLPDDESPEPSLGDCAICMDAILIQSGAQSRRRSTSERPHAGHRRNSSVKEREKEKERERGVRGILDRIEDVAERSAGLRGSGMRRSYAVAPCNHIFHTACLERWLSLKNICPQCRRPLPPI